LRIDKFPEDPVAQLALWTPEHQERSGAILSDCGRFRYSLWRSWGDPGPPRRFANFIMLNPSTADAEADDPTVRCCIGFARAWGMDGLVVTNLYPLRATDPKGLWKADDRGGEWLQLTGGLSPKNAFHLMGYARTAKLVVCAWGANAEPAVAARALELIRGVGAVPHRLRLTRSGQPCHPLYLPASLAPEPMT
jgi:hypothetical protein